MGVALLGGEASGASPSRAKSGLLVQLVLVVLVTLTFAINTWCRWRLDPSGTPREQQQQHHHHYISPHDANLRKKAMQTRIGSKRRLESEPLQPLPSLLGDFEEPPQQQVQKTVVSSKLRLVFVVGLEGAGHHYLIQALEETFTGGKEDLRLNKCPMSKPYVLMTAMERGPENYTVALEQASRDMSALALEGQGLPAAAAVATMQGTFEPNRHNPCYQVGMLSYPTFSGLDKVYQYVDLRQLVENAEKEGIDMRVVYLRRSAKELLISNIVHRRFEEKVRLFASDGVTTHDERKALYMRTLFTVAGAMHSTLAEVSPDFVVCLDYAKIGEAEQTLEVADFVAPTPYISSLLQDTLARTAFPKRTSTEELPDKGIDLLAARLQQKLDVLESPYCGRGGGSGG